MQGTRATLGVDQGSMFIATLLSTRIFPAVSAEQLHSLQEN